MSSALDRAEWARATYDEVDDEPRERVHPDDLIDITQPARWLTRDPWAEAAP